AVVRMTRTKHLPGRVTRQPRGGIVMPIVRGHLPLVLAALAMLFRPTPAARAFDVVLSTQGEFMDAYLVNGQAFPPKVVFIDPDPQIPICPNATDPSCSPPPRVGKHVNGKV